MNGATKTGLRSLFGPKMKKCSPLLVYINTIIFAIPLSFPMFLQEHCSPVPGPNNLSSRVASFLL